MADSAPTPDRDDDETELVAPEEKPMGFLDHLEELRVTLIKCAATLVVFLAAIGYFLLEFKGWLEWPWRYAMRQYPELSLQFRTDSPMEVYGIMVQICVMGSLVSSLPLLLIWIGQFVSPALTKSEKRAVFPAALAAFCLFLGGAAFGFFLLTPKAIAIAIEANQWMGYQMLWTADSYYSLMMWLALGLGGIFEFPLLIVGVTYFGMVDVATLRKSRRLVILICFIVAAVVTPTPDPFTQTFVAVPMYALFETSLIVASALIRRKERAEGLVTAAPAGRSRWLTYLILALALGAGAWWARRDAEAHRDADNKPQYFWTRLRQPEPAPVKEPVAPSPAPAPATPPAKP